MSSLLTPTNLVQRVKEKISKSNSKEKEDMKDKLTIQDLAMFIGGDVELKYNISCMTEPAVMQGQLLGVLGDGRCFVRILSELESFDCEENSSRVKPILRPLSDITDQEAKFIDHVYGAELGYHAEGYKYLISKHFDVFGWIESGLAIDKTKVQVSKEN